MNANDKQKLFDLEPCISSDPDPNANKKVHTISTDRVKYSLRKRSFILAQEILTVEKYGDEKMEIIKFFS